MAQRPIRDNMEKRLTALQLDDVSKEMINLCRREGLNPATLKNDDALEMLLLPLLVERDDEWAGLEGNIEWKGSSARKHFKEQVKNTIRLDGAWLMKELMPKKKAAIQPVDDDDSEDQPEPPTPKPSSVLTRGKKRGQPTAETVPQESVPGTTSTKRQRVDQPEQQTPTITKPIMERIKEIQGVKKLTHEQKVAEIKLVAENIRLRKGELNLLYKAWRVLRVELYPEIDDPMADLK